MLRGIALSIGLFGLGLTVAAAPSPRSSTARALCEKGRQALIDDRTEEAIGLLQQSLQEDPNLAEAHLSLAAAYLGQHRDALAASHLQDYLRLQPDHFQVRRQYAEVLVRLGRPASACDQLERFLAAIQHRGPQAAQHLVGCHTRLMELAGLRGDAYSEHLHRGIALYHLACVCSLAPAVSGEPSTESLLCRAAAELARAHEDCPDEARPCWYLSAAWSRLGQQQAARHWLRAARAMAPLSYLTPCEQRNLALAGREQEELPTRPYQRRMPLACFPEGGSGSGH